MTALTQDQRDAIEKMRGQSYSSIAREVGCNDMSVRRILDPAWYDGRKVRMRAAHRRRRKRVKTGEHTSRQYSGHRRHSEDRAAPPPSVVLDRDRRAAAALTPNMIVLGDPEPGRSCLDRNGQSG